MLTGRKSHGSIAWRFAATVATVMAITLAAQGLFLTFGGVWAQPPIQHTGIPDQVLEIVHIIEAAPPDVRPALADAARSPNLSVSFIQAGSDVARTLGDTRQVLPNSEEAQRLPRQFGPNYRTRIFAPDNPRLRVPLLPNGAPAVTPGYTFAVELPDLSWVVLHADHRFWGLDNRVRAAVVLTILALVTIVISWLAARQLAKPIQLFADAILLFGTNPKAAPMEENGPAEFRAVISAFNVMQDRIQKLMTYRTAMLAAISHDLRTPLTRIRLRGEFIQDPSQQEKLFRDVDELQEMIDGALAFFRGDAQEEKLTPLDLPSIIQTLIDDFADQGVTIPYSGPARLHLLGRPAALKRAIGNVIENAVKYATPPEIAIEATEKQVTITIRDGGPGIPEESLELVFNPFFRLETSRNRATGGVGLGLTAAQSIMREHGGDVTLANRAGGGVEVRVSLPRL